MVLSKRQRCGTCKGCRSVDCGLCKNCKDKPSNGGANKFKQACINRKCTGIKVDVSVNLKGIGRSGSTASPARRKSVETALKQSTNGIKRLPKPKPSPKADMKIKEEPKKEPNTPKRESPKKRKMTPVSKPQNVANLPILEMQTMPKVEMLKLIPEIIKLSVGQKWSSQSSKKPDWWPDTIRWPTMESKWNGNEIHRNNLVQIIRGFYISSGHSDLLKWNNESKKEFQGTQTTPSSSKKSVVHGGKNSPVKSEQSSPAKSVQSSLSTGNSPKSGSKKTTQVQTVISSRNKTIVIGDKIQTASSGSKQSGRKTTNINSSSQSKLTPSSARSMQASPNGTKPSLSALNVGPNKSVKKAQSSENKTWQPSPGLNRHNILGIKGQIKQATPSPLKGQPLLRMSDKSPVDKNGQRLISAWINQTSPCYYGQPSPASSVHRMPKESGQSLFSAETGQAQPSPIKMTTFPKGLYFPFSAEIYICYFCEKEFLNKQKMRDHQKVCSERPPQLHQYQLEVVTDHNTELNDPPQMSPQRRLSPKSSPLPLKEFTNYLDLLPKQTAAKLQAHRASMEIGCDLDELETALPVSPVTPRTPKSLISQLSREDAGVIAKKRLSYSLSTEFKEDIDSSDGENEKDETFTTKEKKGLNLLNIPVSSLLGQRVKNFVHVESPTSVVENTESYCRTPVKNSFLEKLRKKDAFYNVVYKPLRRFNLHKEGHMYKFNRKQRKAFMCKINTGLNLASYREFKSLKRARVDVERMPRSQLLRWVSAPKLDVIMNRRKYLSRPVKYPQYTIVRDTLTGRWKKVVNANDSRWHPQPVSSGPTTCEFPSGPTLLSPNIDKLLGLKKKSSQTPQSPPACNALSLGNYISEEMEAEVSKQKLTLYRSLLYEMSVLKAAVVMKDIGGPDVGDKSSLRSPTQVTSTQSSDSIQTKEMIAVKPLPEGTPVLSGKHVKEATLSRDNYQTLLTLLVPGKEGTPIEKRKTLPAPYVCQTKKAEIKATSDIHQGSNRKESISDDTKEKINDKSGHSGILSVKVTSPNMAAVDKDLLSPDDVVSIASMSSDSDSPNPLCCIGCKVKCLTSRTCSCNSSSTPRVRSPAQLGKDDSVMKPLNVAVVPDMYPTGLDPTDAMCGIPSPISNRSESPVPHTPTKPGLLSDCLDSDSDLDSHSMEKLGCEDTPMCLRSGKKQISVDKTQIINEEKLSTEKPLPASFSKISFLRNSNRSKSLTPSASPYKMESPKSSSFPNSPAKTFTSPSKYCRTPNILSTKRAILYSSPVSSLKTRSMSGSSDSKQRIFIDDNSKSAKLLTPVSSVKKNKDGHLTRITSDVSLEKADVEPRRSKRRLSSFSVESSPLKRRKLSQSAMVNS